MELSFETPDDIYSTYRKPRGEILRPQLTQFRVESKNDGEIIDTTQLTFEEDEFWLQKVSPTLDLHEFLYPNSSLNSSKVKDIDTRTFTRPKKRPTRSSIEKYNEALFEPLPETPDRPHFDVGSTVSSLYFENILTQNSIDPLQNMSPPSLVNSMCSSTFANLMESSYIRDDPILREIRDADYTSSILQKEPDVLYRSMTESFSSLNSDIPENFLKKVAFEEDQTDVERTIKNNFSGSDEISQKTIIENSPHNVTFNAKAVNSTFQRCKTEKSSLSHSSDDVYTPPNVNSTVTILNSSFPKDNKTIVLENVKRLLDRRPSPSPDLNRLSYVADGGATHVNNTFKRNSFGSTDSGENLEYMSLSSSSSKVSEPPEIFSIAQSTIVPFQQVMSTPKHRTRVSSIWHNNHEISPITDCNSDPELSSSELTLLSETNLRKQRSVGNIGTTLVIHPKDGASKMTLPKGCGMMPPKPKSNLNSMGHTLKGSYTSLRPTNANLPVAPPPLNSTVTRTVSQKDVAQNAQFVKPAVPRSGLPRPVTGIPRPVSRIPGPRPVRPVTKSAGPMGRQ